ncbi:MAG: DNA-directed RNA polymerase subunit omega [Pseudomonadota bacterium]
MARVTVEDCLARVENRFVLVHLAAKRVRQLRAGARPMSSRDNKDVVLALREIAGAKVTMDNVRSLEPLPRQERDRIEHIEDVETDD